MKLLVFNPEHDIALASNLANFTAPHAGRLLRSDLGWLPALWAGRDDVVLVDHREHALASWQRIRAKVGLGEARFVEKSELATLGISSVEPWGWDLALRAYLLRHGVTAVPTESEVADIRRLSHRRQAASLLAALRGVEGTVGEAYEVTGMGALADFLADWHRVVLKAPWSSSGRGIRFIDRPMDEAQVSWMQRVVERQGSVMVEPYYDKVRDFGMEFCADAGGIHYVGLSLFQTKNGAYAGNVLAPEQAKREVLGRYIPLSWLDEVCLRIVTRLDLGNYRGSFGVDMMVVRSRGSLRLHPCVELNLRRTMGHVALALTPADDDRKVMRIDFNGQNYKLKINKL